MFHSEQTHLQTFDGENFVYQFVSTDPEGSAVLFTLQSGPKDAVLSPSGLLIWKAWSSSPVTFELAVMDDCNAETRANVKVRSRLCDTQFGSSKWSFDVRLRGKHLFRTFSIIHIFSEACLNTYLYVMHNILVHIMTTRGWQVAFYNCQLTNIILYMQTQLRFLQVEKPRDYKNTTFL